MNLTSRIEGITRLFGASILVADSVARLREPKQFALRPVGRVLPKREDPRGDHLRSFPTLLGEVRERRLFPASGMRRGWRIGSGAILARLVTRSSSFSGAIPPTPAALMYLGECERLKNGRIPGMGRRVQARPK